MKIIRNFKKEGGKKFAFSKQFLLKKETKINFLILTL
jgi:hypothetical protein